MNNLNNAKKDNFSRKTILVTGAAGFIGSRLIVELLRDGHQVVAALRNAATKKEKAIRFHCNTRADRSIYFFLLNMI